MNNIPRSSKFLMKFTLKSNTYNISIRTKRETPAARMILLWPSAYTTLMYLPSSVGKIFSLPLVLVGFSS